MNNPKVSIIVAHDNNRGIGKSDATGGTMLWRIPADLQRFKSLTTGHVLILGRKTFDSLQNYYQKSGRPIPQRTHIVVTRNPNYSAPNCISAISFEEALKIAKQMEREEIFVSGGGQIYAQAIHFADKLYLTLVDGAYDADTFFPEYISLFTKEMSREEREYNGLKYTFLELEKV